MRHFVLVLTLLTLGLSTVKPARAQATVEVSDTKVVYRFGEQVNFQGRVKASAPIQDVVILFRAQGESSTRSGAATLTEDGQVNYSYRFEQGTFPSFAPVNYWFRVTLQSGEKIESSPSSFDYIDNRFPWKSVEDGKVRLHWYTGDDAFALEARDIARQGLKKTSEMLSVTPDHVFDVYVYALPADMQLALQNSPQKSSIGGEASPELGVALVAISPGLEQAVAMERKIPHELAHLLTYQLVGEHYGRLPVWLREGIASMAEPANPDYAELISTAQDQQAFIAMEDLCGAFPPEVSRALLAYAQSESFTRYIVNQYGDSGLVSLANAYADGLDCQQGATRALGPSLNHVESDWLNSLAPGGSSPAANFDNGFLPYLALLLIMMIAPLGFIAAVWRTPYGGQRSK